MFSSHEVRPNSAPTACSAHAVEGTAGRPRRGRRACGSSLPRTHSQTPNQERDGTFYETLVLSDSLSRSSPPGLAPSFSSTALPAKASQRYNIGRYGEPWTLEQARAEAGRLRSLVDRGLDPLTERRREATGGRSLAELAELVLAHVEKCGRRPATLYGYRRLLRLHILPRLGRLRVEEFGVEHAERLHADLKRTPCQANQAVVVLGRCLTLAERWGWIPRSSNPVRWVDRYPRPRRGEKKGVMLRPELDLPRFSGQVTVWDREAGEGGISPATRSYGNAERAASCAHLTLPAVVRTRPD